MAGNDLGYLRQAFFERPTLASASAYFNKAMDLWTAEPQQMTDADALQVNREVVAWCKANNYNLERLGLIDRDVTPTRQQFDQVFGS